MSGLDRLRKVAEAATAGPWRTHRGRGREHFVIVPFDGASWWVPATSPEDAAFIAQSRATYLALLDIAEAVENEMAYAYTDHLRRLHFPKTTHSLARLRQVAP